MHYDTLFKNIYTFRMKYFNYARHELFLQKIIVLLNVVRISSYNTLQYLTENFVLRLHFVGWSHSSPALLLVARGTFVVLGMTIGNLRMRGLDSEEVGREVYSGI